MGLPPWSGRVSDGEPACKRQNQLGRRVATDSATITGIVNRLMQRGWVTSSAHAEDARLCLIELTDAGREVVEQLLPQGIAISKETLAPLSEGESATLIELLRRIAADGDEPEPGRAPG
jgi:DNA-binding MarR family transcriptional regulator